MYSPTRWGPEPFLVRDSFDPLYDTRDLGFQMYVRIPEPSELALATLTAAMLRFQRRRPQLPSRDSRPEPEFTAQVLNLPL
jgi:hypothetical protein